VKKEMEWTMNWLEKKVSEWKFRGYQADLAGLRGHACYAGKQQIIWLNLYNQAKAAFEGKY